MSDAKVDDILKTLNIEVSDLKTNELIKLTFLHTTDSTAESNNNSH